MIDLKNINIIRSDRRSISVHIEPDGEVVVKAPKRIADRNIKQFISEHSDWIEKHLSIVRSRLQKNQIAEDEYLFLGKTLKLKEDNIQTIKMEGDFIFFPKALVFRKEKELKSWYIKQAEKIIPKQIDLYAARMKTNYRSVLFSDTRSKWGSCSHDNRLQFSWRLVMAPLLVINYVVIHELSHTMEKNHTQMFWMKVRSQNPSYKQQIKWLKEYGVLMHRIF